MEFGKLGKRHDHDTIDRTDFKILRRQLVTDCYKLATGKLRGNCCNGFWPWHETHLPYTIQYIGYDKI